MRDVLLPIPLDPFVIKSYVTCNLSKFAISYLGDRCYTA